MARVPSAAPRTSAPAVAARPIGFLLQRAHTILRERLAGALSESGLHLGHVAVLGTLLDAPGLSQRELGARTGIEKSSMVIFVDALERDGWLKRERHPTDRRTQALFLTEAGAMRLADIGPRLRAVEEQYLAVLAPQERTALEQTLDKLIAGPDPRVG
ncbi:MAG: putative MarR family transcriptional regulator [Sphingomonas bacterium]|uniref:MarR family winged helix-turn-helix transcriptional regulator n=1 Tax=Sphingomonas bacterium TaxID=1895847 RepID=UPI002631A721|nr:MarR family winged helix-turn-helix transcriptional regulator [Sphingomonas bacterium]MDB5703500.1 putative MarR family transcriptional regulator [Sphingomonas bacterium]